mmetsp:Transcript_5068/g.14271  ORF Transcript_5068/g.14271 Transcript_5068/m.14271 type:complete len:203 (+) Transcript_5068:76-684(+)
MHPVQGPQVLEAQVAAAGRDMRVLLQPLHPQDRPRRPLVLRRRVDLRALLPDGFHGLGVRGEAQGRGGGLRGLQEDSVVHLPHAAGEAAAGFAGHLQQEGRQVQRPTDRGRATEEADRRYEGRPHREGWHLSGEVHGTQPQAADLELGVQQRDAPPVGGPAGAAAQNLEQFCGAFRDCSRGPAVCARDAAERDRNPGGHERS